MFIYPAIEKNPLLHLCITEPLRLGSAEILFQNEQGILAYDVPSRLHLLSASNAQAAQRLLAHVENPYFILCCNGKFAPLLDRFGLQNSMLCRQWAYLKEEAPEADPRLRIAPPDDRDFSRILETYRMSTLEELTMQRNRGQIFFAREENGREVGFVGLHPEGCFGMLEVFPRQRGKGYGAALQGHIIRWCMENGRIPYCQVSLENEISNALQKKMGLTPTSETLIMAWNDRLPV